MTSPRWITALAVLRYSNVFASGSWEGMIRLWKLNDQNRSFSLLATVPAPGVINSLQMISPPIGALDEARWVSQPPAPSAELKGQDSDSDDSLPDPHPSVALGKLAKHSSRRHCVITAAIAQEPRLGRWLRIAGEGTGSRNGVLVVAVPYNEGSPRGTL